MASKSLHILGLQAENFKRIRAINIKPDGSLVQIRGRNGQGKTSVLDAIWVALAGKSAMPTTPIRKGAEEARIRLDLGELIVTRTFSLGKESEVTTNLTVTAADGARYGSPQTMLDKLVGSLSFDPLDFTRLDAKKQFDVLRQFVPGVDFDAIQRAHDGDMDRRRDINRQAKEARAAAAALVIPEGTPAEPVDETALVKALESAGELNLEIERRAQNRATAQQQVTTKQTDAQRLRDRATELRVQADKLQAEAETMDKDAADLLAKLASAEPLPHPADTAEIRAEIEKARTTNAAVTKVQQRVQHLARAVELEKQSEAITAAMEKRQADKVEAISAAKMPVPGITFGEGEILLGGVPFSQGSDAEQLRASIAIAAAMNPRLRVIRVRDGSLLDAESLALVAQFATEHDLQVWAEIVDSKGETGIVIEDGAVRAAVAQEDAA
jgi:DNA repair exonuclease SbcCD ATPase subunit